MLFNSIDFAIFLPIVFVFYWFVVSNNIRYQNLFLTVVSYIFYGWWDYRFLSLILFSTVLDFAIGRRLKGESNVKVRKRLLLGSILVNLGFLGFFKYYNFFLDNFISAFSFFGYEISASSLKIILPVGISFYTFQTLSYSIDVYRRKLEPCTDFFAFSAFVCFFPQLVAGPIERATNLLPQFYKKREFVYNNAVDGMRQILWGLFKKMVIADNCAYYANQIFNNHEAFNGSTLFVGAIFFTFQIYGDFSGYSDIAIGTSRLFGFDLKQNFAFPYFSRDIAEFWRRWHISLSTWFRDYLYIPLGGSRVSTPKKVRNTFAIFLVSGFWHGANWTFVIWGFLNAFYFLPSLLSNKNRKYLNDISENRLLPSFGEILLVLKTFFLTVFAWIFFRAESVSHAISYLSEIFSTSFFQLPDFEEKINAILVTLLIVFLLTVEWLGRRDKYGLEKILFKVKSPLHYLFYLILILMIISFSGVGKQEFIYFQF